MIRSRRVTVPPVITSIMHKPEVDELFLAGHNMVVHLSRMTASDKNTVIPPPVGYDLRSKRSNRMLYRRLYRYVQLLATATKIP